jgi:anti-anti-sigma factor
MTESGRFDILYAKDHPIVEVTGDLDLNNVEEFEATLELAAGADRGSVVVSLARATYFDSQAIHVLLRFAEHLAVTRQRLLIVVPRGALPRRILEIAGLAQAFPMFETVEEALTARLQAGKPSASKHRDSSIRSE